MGILTPARLKSLSSRSLLSNSWYFIAAATFSVCNRPEEIPTLFEYVLSETPSPNQKLKVAREIREALFKGCAIAGLPKTINALTHLKNVTPTELRETSLQREFRQTIDVNKGAAFFDQVYGKISSRVFNQLSTAYPDLAHYTIGHVYAPLLSFSNVLGPKQTSLVVIACLIPQDVNPQLKGHLKGALNNGATREEVEDTRALSMEICQWCGVNWREEVARL
jgi:alkylhydroperoxidase/carboxymuconolactone decarboxylase family protein YurZ